MIDILLFHRTRSDNSDGEQIKALDSFPREPYYIILYNGKICCPVSTYKNSWVVLGKASRYDEALCLAQLISLENCIPLHEDIVALFAAVEKGLITL